MNCMNKLRDYKMECAFSFIRWFLLCICAVLFWIESVQAFFHLERESVSTLFIISLCYILITQYSLWKMIASGSHTAKQILQIGVCFDFLALMWLLMVTGGVNSPLAPMTYLVIMHAAFYWNMQGAIIATGSVIAGFIIIFLLKGQLVSESMLFPFFLHIGLTAIVGLFAGFIVARERKHFYEKVTARKQVRIDYLTGLYNQRFFHESLRRIVRETESCTLVMADVDHFKLINDQYGHVMGDLVLKEIGKILAECVRKEKGRAFRYGGEEFAFLFPNANHQCIKRVIETIYKELAGQTFGDNALKVTMSFGVASWQIGEKENEWLERADSLLYKAKNMGRNRAIFDDESILVNPTSSKRGEKYNIQTKITV
jgi:diguanylate cyclase